jgi:hypothetical protein
MKYIKSLAIMALGFWLTTVGVQMSHATLQSKHEESSKGKNAAIGAGIGAGAGLVTWLVIGGVGIATGGVGLGLGALGLTAIGAGAGALGGAATGTTQTIVQSTPLYSPWGWGAVIVAGVCLAYWGGSAFRKTWNERTAA